MKKTVVSSIILICALVSFLFLRGANERENLQSFALDTVINISAPKKDSKYVREAFSLCRDYEKIFSRTLSESELFKINRGEKTAPSPALKKVIDFSLSVSKMTDGAFDISVAPLTELWDVKKRTVPPSDAEILEALKNVGWKKITLSPFSTGGRELDLGAVAKGCIADSLTDFFKEKNVSDVIIDLGGNVALIGEFTVGIRDPFNPDKLFAKIRLKDKSAVTSGAYQRYFEYDSKIYHHIIDPRTGYCAESSLASVTVISPSSMCADALSTAIFILGESSLSLCESFPDTDALLITKDGKTITTEGFSEKYELTPITDKK